jgi:cephalosporin hydroxylase
MVFLADGPEGTALDERFFTRLIAHTDNFGRLSWMGVPIWQNILDLWVIQETIVEIQPQLLIETGTNRGGSSLFYAHLFDLLGHGQIVTIDIEKMHDLVHPRIIHLLGSSISADIVEATKKIAERVDGSVMVILDSDHSKSHVGAELEAYASLVTPRSFLLVQDGVIDTLPSFANGRPGPLAAIRDFLCAHPEFEIDSKRGARFPITHHPHGWLRRKL